jgi:methylated-DNA-[protein]-cysteine S-methyltransferase
MESRFPDVPECAPPHEVQHAIDRIIALLQGRPTSPANLSDITLDMTGIAPFHRSVYALARQMAPGETTTYGEMARQLGAPGAARAVGLALGYNPFAPVVPCHRILAADGRSGGFCASGGVRTKLRLLEIEGAQFGGSPGLFDDPPPGGQWCRDNFALPDWRRVCAGAVSIADSGRHNRCVRRLTHRRASLA